MRRDETAFPSGRPQDLCCWNGNGTVPEISCCSDTAKASDAYHMSTPHPEGRGAARAMERALDRAGIKPTDIDYINLHGTGDAGERAG